MEPRRPPSRARDATHSIPDLSAARTTSHTLRDRLAYLAGPCPPAPIVQRRMLRALAQDAGALSVQLDTLADVLDNMVSRPPASVLHLLQAPANCDTSPAPHMRRPGHRAPHIYRTRAGEGGAAPCV